MKDKVYIVYAELLEDANDAYTEIVGGVFYRDILKAKAKMVAVFDDTIEALKDEHNLVDCDTEESENKMVFSADGRVSLVMRVVPLEEEM